ncbi:unnamed protein product [Prorocentrum cordatum]|uniref:RRM domain-containing protein n=1 Tax=Prorocentrum cordatum TaxID=2364126 RepID=A0ABN9U798_9DINO|nr:unnamed protein product [Polarella glacialis]
MLGPALMGMAGAGMVGPPQGGVAPPKAEKLQAKKEKDMKVTTVFVGGLRKSTSEDKVAGHFARFGQIDNVDIKRQPDGTSRGFAFVKFLDKDAVDKVIEARADHMIDNKWVAVRPHGGKEFEAKLSQEKAEKAKEEARTTSARPADDEDDHNEEKWSEKYLTMAAQVGAVMQREGASASDGVPTDQALSMLEKSARQPPTNTNGINPNPMLLSALQNQMAMMSMMGGMTPMMGMMQGMMGGGMNPMMNPMMGGMGPRPMMPGMMGMPGGGGGGGCMPGMAAGGASMPDGCIPGGMTGPGAMGMQGAAAEVAEAAAVAAAAEAAAAVVEAAAEAAAGAAAQAAAEGAVGGAAAEAAAELAEGADAAVAAQRPPPRLDGAAAAGGWGPPRRRALGGSGGGRGGGGRRRGEAARAGGLGGEAWPAATRLAVGLALAANLLGSGVIFGFAPLQVLLEEDGVFQGLCGKEASVCPERTSQLVLLYTLGSTAAILCGPVGFVVDWAGPVASNALSGGVASLGLALLGAAPPDGLAPLAAGAVLTGFGGAAILMASLPLGFVVPAAAEGPVLSAVNVCFDASSVVFLLVYRLYASLGLSRRALLVGHAAVIATLHLGLVAAWSCGPAQRLRARQAEELKLAAAACQDDAACGAAALAPDALQSWEFRFVLVFFTAQMFRSNFYLGTNKALLEAYGDASTGYAYTQVFAAFLPVSVVCLPLAPPPRPATAGARAVLPRLRRTVLRRCCAALPQVAAAQANVADCDWTIAAPQGARQDPRRPNALHAVGLKSEASARHEPVGDAGASVRALWKTSLGTKSALWPPRLGQKANISPGSSASEV